MRPTALLSLCILVLAALPGQAAGPETPREVLTDKISLSFQTPDAVMRLLRHDTLPARPDQATFRSDSGTVGWLVPEGITSLLGYTLDNSIIARGTPQAVRALKQAVAVVDAQVRETPGRLQQVTLKPTVANRDELRAGLLKLPMAGTVVVRERTVELEGSPAWMHQALRLVLRAELQEKQ